MQNSKVRAGHRTHAVLNARYPRDSAAVIEPQLEFHVHGHSTFDALHDSHNVGVSLSDGHEVDESNYAMLTLEGGFKNKRMVAIATRALPFASKWLDPPKAIF